MTKISLILLLTYFCTPIFADFQDNLPSNFPDKLDQRKQKTPQPKQQDQNPAAAKKSNTLNNSPTSNSDFGFSAHNKSAPIIFSGDHGSGSRNRGVLNLVGNAIISQDNTTLRSNKAQLFTRPGQLPSPGSTQIQKAVAIGNVRITKKKSEHSSEMKATSDKAEFIFPERIVILKGNAKVWRDQEYINGATIKLSLATGDIEIIQPQGTISPSSIPSNASKSVQ